MDLKKKRKFVERKAIELHGSKKKYSFLIDCFKIIFFNLFYRKNMEINVCRKNMEINVWRKNMQINVWKIQLKTRQ